MGRTLGRYRLMHKLGAEGQGEVYLGYAGDAKIRTPVAIKVVGSQHQGNREVSEALLNEAKLLSKIRHNRIGAFYEFCELETERFLVLEYVEGVSLREFIQGFMAQKYSIPLPAALYIASEIAAGLEYLHRFVDPDSGESAQLIHGDFHPGNVMLTAEGEIKLIDFGLASLENHLNRGQLRVSWANIRYASPDRLLLQRLSPADDMFGLGVVLWELCTGQRYWGKMEPEAIAEAVKEFSPRDPHEIVPDLPQEICAIIKNCLLAGTIRGYTAAEDVFRDLNSALRAHGEGIVGRDLRDLIQANFAAAFQKKRESRINSGSSADQETQPTATLELHPPMALSLEEERDSKQNAPTRDARIAPVQWRESRGQKWALIRLMMILEFTILIVGACLSPQVLYAGIKHSPWMAFRYLHESTYYQALEFYNDFSAPITRNPAHELGGGIPLVVKSNPPGAQVWIDDEIADAHTPARIRLKRKGLSLISLRRLGYKEKWLYVDSAKTDGVLQVELAPLNNK